MTTEREAFEEWVCNVHCIPSVRLKYFPEHDYYFNDDVQDMYAAFKAGRAPLLKRIEELEADKEEYLSMKRECTNENCCC